MFSTREALGQSGPSSSETRDATSRRREPLARRSQGALSGPIWRYIKIMSQSGTLGQGTAISKWGHLSTDPQSTTSDLGLTQCVRGKDCMGVEYD